MPMEQRSAELLLTGGLDVKEHAEAEGPSGFRKLDGFRFGETGKLERTPATDSVTLGTGVPHTLFRREKELATLTEKHGVVRLADGTATRSLAATVFGVTPTEDYGSAPAEVSRRIIAQAQFGVDEEYVHTVVCAETAGGDLLFGWVAYRNGGYIVRARVYTTDGVLVSQHDTYTTVTATAAPVISACTYQTTGAILTYSNLSSSPYTIVYLEYTDSTRGWNSGNLTTAASSTSHKVRYASASEFYLMYLDNSGSAYLTVETRTVSAVSATHTATHTATDFDVVVGSSQVLVCSINSGNQLITEKLGTPGTTATSATAGTGKTYNKLTCTQKDSGDVACCFIFGSDSNVVAQDFVDTLGVDFSGSITGDFIKFTTPNTAFISGSFSVGGIPYCPLTTGRGTSFTAPAFTNVGAAVIVARLSDAEKTLRPIARVMHDRAFKHPLNVVPTTGTVVSGNTIHIALTGDPAADGVPSSTTTFPQSVFWNTIKLGSDCAPLSYAENASTTIVAGGILYDYDGVVMAEAQPLRRPACYIGTPGTTISVRAVYTWVDRAGKLHRSAPSDAILIDATNNVHVEVPPFIAWNPTYAPGGLSVELYATESGPGSLYYLANNSNKKDDVDSTSTGGMFYVFSSVAAGSATDPPLYTDGGELASEPPPSFVSVATVGDRMFGVDAEERRRWWTSKPFVEGFAPEWNTVLTGFLGSHALAVHDVQGVPTFFCEDGVYQLYGEGPDANGNGSFAPPRKVLDLGCVSRASVVDTPVGTFFQTHRGFVIFAGGQVQDIGTPVEPETNARTLTVKRALYDEANHEIRVQCASVIYYYSITNNAWSKLSLSTAEVDSAIVDGVVHRASATAFLTEKRRGDSGYNQRAGDSTWETPWIKLDGLTGYGRLWRLLLALQMPSEDLSSNCTITITMYADFDLNTVASQWEYTGTEMANWITDGVEWLRLKPARRRIVSYKLKCEVTGSLSHSGIVPLSVRQEYGFDPKGRRRIGRLRKVSADQPTVTVTSP